MKMLTGTCLWSLKVIPEAVKDIRYKFMRIFPASNEVWTVDTGENRPMKEWEVSTEIVSKRA